MNLQQKVQSFIQKHQLLTREGPVLVGVSGGTDSVALLHILISLGYDCIAAHCNFHLRIEESNRDEAFVHSLSQSYAIPFYSIDFETTKYAEQHKISIEMAARDLRFDWFEEMLNNTGCQAIAVAHHADDSIETMLMNLVRGTGLRGLTGIQPRNRNVVRPLLCCTREELDDYIIEHCLEHVEDSTNQENNYTRNKFRNELLPLLSEINPTARENLYKSLANLEANFCIYEQAISKIRDTIVEKSGNDIRINIDKLNEQVHIPVVLFELLSPYGFGSVQTEQIAEALNVVSGKVFYSDTHRLVKDRKYLIINAKDDRKENIYTVSQDTTEINFAIHLTIRKMQIDESFSPSKLPNCVHFDAELLEFPLELRCWKEGDVFYPFGMTQKKKLSDFFIDQKFSIPEKEQCWLLVSGDKIVWIVGHRLDNRFRISEKTREVIEFQLISEQ
ncbi:MAG: tRNA lysidine(34) synthetase TilS [Paludibacter sp.]